MMMMMMLNATLLNFSHRYKATDNYLHQLHRKVQLKNTADRTHSISVSQSD